MDMCTANGLNQVDLLTPAERKISEKDTGQNAEDKKNLINTMHSLKERADSKADYFSNREAISS